jgi:hypothetical protein
MDEPPPKRKPANAKEMSPIPFTGTDDDFDLTVRRSASAIKPKMDRVFSADYFPFATRYEWRRE